MDSLTDTRPISRLEIVDTGRRRRWSDEAKVRIVEESLSGPRLASATARGRGISNQLLFSWRHARLTAEANAAVAAVNAAVAKAEAANAQADLSSSEALIAHLKLAIEKLRPELYGTRRERSARLLDQMEL